jgi:hypothetical protein
MVTIVTAVTPWNTLLFEQPVVARVLKESPPSFMKDESSSPCSQQPLHWTLRWAELIQCTTFHTIVKVHFNIILPYMLKPPKCSRHFRFPDQIFVRIPQLPHACYMPQHSHRPLFDSRNNGWRKLQFWSCTASCYFLCLSPHAALCTLSPCPSFDVRCRVVWCW